MRPTVIASFGYGQWSRGVYFLFSRHLFVIRARSAMRALHSCDDLGQEYAT